jgi:Protein of unknown function (DUF1579)
MSRSLLCLVTILGTSAIAQEPLRPTAEHEILASDEGTWDATITSYLPHGKPAVYKGTEVNTVLAGGLWVASKFEADIGGRRFEGRGHFGYDPLKKQYVGTWIDSLSPILSLLEGRYDAKTKTMTYEGEYIDFGDKAKYTQRMVTTLKENGTRHFTLIMKPAGSEDEVKIMEVEYIKRK